MNASLQAIVDTYTSPKQAFAQVRDQHVSAWVPLLLILVSTTAVTTWYFTSVDPQAFMAEQIALSGQTMSPEELAMASEQMAGFLPFSGVMPVLFLLVVYALVALYLHMVASVGTDAELKYGRWFSLVCYAFLPSLVGLITIAVGYAMAGDRYVSFATLDLTSLNNLVLHWPQTHPWTGMINALSLSNLWVALLLIVGFKTLTGASWGGAIVTVLIPFVLLFGGWAAFIVW
ncbi:YIP1 family protein [Saccharospirillum salsuginis]|nr:YIP1 family protein [Saccharospirillum salsuginis]